MAGPAQQTKTAAAAKSTLDYIPSKLGYDTVIPVSILEDRTEFIEKCKPYDIIDGPNPLDEPEVSDVTLPQTPGVSVSSAAKVTQSGRSSGCSIRKSASSLLRAEKDNHVKQETDDEEERSGGASLVFTRPSRTGWAQERLAERRPYQILRSHDIETRARYVLDDMDYDWCKWHDISPESLQRGVTYLEWAYVSSLIKAAMPTVGALGASASTTCVSVVKRNADELQSSKKISSSSSSSPTAGNGRRTTSRLQKGRNGLSAGESAVHVCALCSKPVQLLPSQPQTGAMKGGMSTAHPVHERPAEVRHSLGAPSSLPIAHHDPGFVGGGRRGAPAPHSSLPVPATNGQSANASFAVAFPSHDFHSKGLRCTGCGVVAHLRCWCLAEPPKWPEAWTCEGCTISARHRKRSAGVCCMCGRPGGVLLAYVSCPPKGEGKGAQLRSSSHVSAQRRSSSSSSSAIALSETVCHAVCALSIPELAVHPQDTVSPRNGSGDAPMRPYVYATRRLGKHKFAMTCAFCQCGVGRCVQCSHPHCFEAMHASCAAEAHTVDCESELPLSLAAAHSSIPCTVARNGAAPLHGVIRPISSGNGCSGSLKSTISWSSCSLYCRRHYGYSASNSVKSAQLDHKAEAEALALDLTGLLTGGDGVTSPVVRKRGRGRPPAALVQQREAERELIEKLRRYWLERREQRRQSSAQLVSEINARLRPIVEASLRPEIVKISVSKVRLSHFLSLVPEWQSRLVAIVEGELPLPDEEYDDAQKYRKAAHTRRSGNTRSLYERMCGCAVQLDLLCQVSGVLKKQCALRRSSVEQELAALRLLSGWQWEGVQVEARSESKRKANTSLQ
ncbi:hypothetical protein JKF63_00735 [Porcisia hertigi]|uniref:Uncharacterized protein n=1 Tax=Porcisia hertigi TaxID=2761500 RepID=A0A836HFM4_9TRYP|nr:hypothetical protein JKF63_00735 [Porcisia hertigi]